LSNSFLTYPWKVWLISHLFKNLIKLNQIKY
jgi:hypothetical protein